MPHASSQIYAFALCMCLFIIDITTSLGKVDAKKISMINKSTNIVEKTHPRCPSFNILATSFTLQFSNFTNSSAITIMFMFINLISMHNSCA